MTNSLVNFGTYLSKKFESRYSIIRRILSINPGVPYSYVLNTIRGLQKKTFHSNSTIQQAILEDIASISSSVASGIPKQCPICAKNLYHSDFYNIAWLEHCPIHNRKMTTRCPCCKKEWPKENEIASRKCSGCGRQDVFQISESLKHWCQFSVNKLEPVEKILEHEDISIATRSNNHYREELLKKDWWIRPSNDDLFFYTCQFNEQTKRMQSKLIDIQPKLVNIRSRNFTFTTPDKRTPNSHSRQLSNQKIRKFALKALNDQLSWIDSQQKGSHRVSILDYRYLSAEHLAYMSNPCEYCLPISLWFFKIASFLSGNYFYYHGGRYPFLDTAALPDLFTIYEPSLNIDQDIKSLDLNFKSWFLLRTYKVDFILLLTFMKHLQDQINIWRKSYKIYNSTYKPSECDCQKYMISQRNGKFKIYFQDEDPLINFKVKLINTTKSNCSRHQSDFIKITKGFYVNSNQIDDKKCTPLFTHDTGKPPITMKQFESLLEEYQARQYNQNRRGLEYIANNKYTYRR